jgi:hypothetical protein
MTSSKRLSSISHSIAHHAVSGLSYVHPHLRQAASKLHEALVFVDLLADEPCPKRYLSIEPVRLSLNALKSRFREILLSEGFECSDLVFAGVMFEFTAEFPDEYCSNCHALLISKKEREYRYSVNYMGETILPNKTLQRTSR